MASGLSYSSIAWAPDGALLFSCPLRCVSHRDGVHECHPLGRMAATEFVRVGYDQASNTSLIRCSPLTGRTHQIRIHLQQLGYPIANDPCYGGDVKFGSDVEETNCDAIDNHSQPADDATASVAQPATTSVVGSATPGFTETQLRCRGIWLHALRYGGEGFSFETPEPVWSTPFR